MFDFHSASIWINVDYNRVCDDPDDTYERSSYLEDIHVDLSDIPVELLINALYNALEKDKTTSFIDKYCFNRICRHYKIYDSDVYSVSTRSGYYGEEIDTITFDNEGLVKKSYEECKALSSDAKKILYVLRLEYGYLLEELKDITNASIIKTPLSSIQIPNKEVFVNIEYVNTEFAIAGSYENYDLPWGIIMRKENGPGYRLIDGIHRLYYLLGDRGEDPDEVRPIKFSYICLE